MVLRLKEKLGEIKEAAGVENIIIFRPDRYSLIDLRPEFPIGAIYPLPRLDESFDDALKQGEGISTGSYRMESGKLFISAYAPISDDEGNLFAVVGVDAGTREVEVIEQMRTRLYFVAGIGVLLAFLLALVLARTLTRPIIGMASTAQRIGRGDYNARVPIPAFKELGVLADSINEMARQVQSRDGKLKEMSASVAHEIRNPLNSIKLLVTLLNEELKEDGGDVPAETIETLHHEIGKLNRFLTEFLTYSRPMTLTKDQVPPEDLARSAADMARAEAKEKGIEIILSPKSHLPGIQIDRDRLEQSLLNLLLNAVYACDEGGRVEMKIDREKDENFVRFVIEDSGPGISEDVMQRLFEPFFTTKETGTGLGLSNTEKIVKSHGGDIFAENIPAGGARFILRLPVNQAGSKE
jgi:signal transduction histidine kinase